MNNQYYYNEGKEESPFDSSRIKMKKIQGRDLGISRADKAMMLCC